MKNLIYIIFLQLVSVYSFAADTHKSCIFGNCITTPELSTSNRPGDYHPYNDLTRMSGDFENYYADQILIRGVVVDKDCLPISNAKVLIWQRDEYGDYRYLQKFATPYEKYDANYKMYSQFRGNGKAFSDNAGRFSFITVRPSKPKTKRMLDDINMSVSVNGFVPLSTKVSIHNAMYNTTESKKHKIGAVAHFNKDASRFYGQEVYDVYIVLNGFNKYRRY